MARMRNEEDDASNDTDDEVPGSETCARRGVGW